MSTVPTDPRARGCRETGVDEPGHDNRPGQPTLNYRIGAQGRFLERMLAGLARQELPAGDHAGQRPLARLTTRAPDDAAIAMLDAWAGAADVLAFYQERIANEGFLRTATERRSVLELARAIGYELKPGVAAGAWLAFTVDDSAGAPDTAIIEAGAQVQSLPMRAGELPQTFETGAGFIAHVGWNRLRPQLTGPQTLTRETTELLFEGTATQLQAGDRLLVLGAAKKDHWSSDQWDIRRVLGVENQPDQQRTRVRVTAGSRPWPKVAEVHALRRRASIFGHNAPDWNSLSKQQRSDYLNLDAVEDLPIADPGEWPDFSLCAPGATPGPGPVFTRELHVTTRQVADAALGAADAQAGVLSRGAMAAVPATVMEAAQGIATVARAIAGAGVTELNTLRETFPLDPSGDQTDHPLGVIADNIVGIIEKLIAAVGLQPPELDWQALPEGDDFFQAIVELVVRLNNRMNDLVADLREGITTLTVEAPDLSGHLDAIGGALNQLRRAHPLLLPFKILEDLQTELGDTFRQAGAAADAVAAAGSAGAVALVLKGVIEAVMPLEPPPGDLARIARFTVKTARYGGMLAAPQTLFADLDLTDFDYAAPYPQLMAQLGERLPAELRDLHDPEDQLALQIAIGVAAVGPAAAPIAIAAAATGGVPAVAVAALGTGLLPLILMGPSVQHGCKQIADAVELAVAKALEPATETVISRRPVFSADGCRVDLDSRYDAIGPDSWVYLEADSQGELFRVTGVGNQSRAEYLISAETTRLTLDGPALKPFESKVRQTKVYGAPEKLTLARQALQSPVQGLAIDLEGLPDPLPPAGARLIVKGLTVSGAPHAEPVTLASVLLLAGRGRLSLAAPLNAVYRRDTVEIFANVVAASHGETVAGEVLGSGDGTRPNQRFTLRRPPLTWVSAATAGGAETTLEVRVNDLLWQPVASLYGKGPEDRVYTLRIDDEANATVIFGDGREGARLPTGGENIRAGYRFGIGRAGDVGADTLSLLKKRPFGVRSVTNPLAAAGAADPEPLEKARRNAPLTVLTLERIVSLQDFEDFARAFAGIGKAQAMGLWDGEGRRVHITLADDDGDPLPVTILENLRKAMDAARGDRSTVGLALDNYQRLEFCVKASVRHDPAYPPEKLQSAIEQALIGAFSFGPRGFGQPVTGAEIIGAIHGVAGVMAVDLDGLYFKASPDPGPATVLAARTARGEGGLILPAQLLLLDPGGIQLTLEAG